MGSWSLVTREWRRVRLLLIPRAQRADMFKTVLFTIIGLAALSEVRGQAAEFQSEAEPALNCPKSDRARKGDKVIMEYIGLLANGTEFDRGQSEFTIGENKVIPGWEKGMTGGCAGEKINMIVPPEFGYGDNPSDKVPPQHRRDHEDRRKGHQAGWQR